MRFTSTYFRDTVHLMVDSMPILGVRYEDGRPLLKAVFLDEDNLPYVIIDDNELVQYVDGLDFELTRVRPPHSERGPRLVVRTAPRDIVLELEFRPPRELIVHRGRFPVNGVVIEVAHTGLRIGNTAHSEGSFTDCDIGICVGEKRPGASVAMYSRRVNRYQGAGPQSTPDE